jgi:hypothetical protein
MAWIQDDSEVLPGWLDAMLDAARLRPDVAACGVVTVTSDGNLEGFSGGAAIPFADPGAWNLTDPTSAGVWPEGAEEREWITSKGMLVRTAAWDDVGGPCALQYPLNHVDKEFCTHLRAHGWRLLVVPEAQISHHQSQSAPGLFRHFLAQWQADSFAARWAGPVEALSGGTGPVEHECHGHPDLAAVERECLHQSSRMIVPFSRFVTEHGRALEQAGYERGHREGYDRGYREGSEHVAAQAAAASQIAAERQEDLARLRASRSWRVTAPLRWAGSALRRIGTKQTERPA